MRTALVIALAVVTQAAAAQAVNPATQSAPASKPTATNPAATASQPARSYSVSFASPKELLNTAHEAASRSDWEIFAKCADPGSQKVLGNYLAMHSKLLALQQPVLKLAQDKLGAEGAATLAADTLFRSASLNLDPLAPAIKDGKVDWAVVDIKPDAKNENATVTFKNVKDAKPLALRKFGPNWGMANVADWNPAALTESTAQMESMLPVLETYYASVKQALQSGAIKKDNVSQKLNDLWADAVKSTPETQPATGAK